MIIREIGSNKTCNISNEQFYKIDTEHLDKNELLEGNKYKVYKKALKAVWENEYNIKGKVIRFADAEVNDNIMTIYLREKWHQLDKMSGMKFSFKYNSKTSIKYIKEEMLRQLNT